MNKLIQILKSRTVLYALLLAVLSVLQGFVFLLPVSPIYQMYAGIAIAVGVVILRAITTEPLIKP
ncbi:hypothetical protein P26059A_0122 [Curvibacter phage P26059A]|nr:hypothetical protein P26059A_0122 [Curvibacter phage P26059A]